MTDEKRAVPESSPDPKVEPTAPVEPTENVEPTNVEESTPEVDKDKTEPTEDNINNNAEGNKTPPPSEETRNPKTEKRFQALVDQIKEKDRLLNQYKKEEPEIELKFDQDEDGNQIVDPNNLVQVAEDRAYRRAMASINEQKRVEATQQRAGEFLEDAEKLEEKLKANPALEKMATKIFHAENYVINPMNGEKVFVPNKKLSAVVSEIEAMLGEFSTKAQADLQTNLSQQAEEGALRPSESDGGSSDISEAEQQELLRKDPNKLNEILRKKLPYAN